MMETKKVIISKYERNNVSRQTNILLHDKLTSIRNGKYKDEIVKCRLALQEQGKKAYNLLKDRLPAVTFSGTFGEARHADKIINYNKLLVLDIDGLDAESVNPTKKIIENDPHTLSVFISPSGQGLKFLVKVESDVLFHKMAFKAIDKYYKEKYNIHIDKSGSDCSRLCYVSWDSDLYLNEDSTAFIYDYSAEPLKAETRIKSDSKKALITNPVDKKSLHATYGLNKEFDRLMIKKIITYLKKNKKSITTTHETWYKCAYAIANTFSHDIGEKIFLQLCELDGEKYDKLKSQERLEYCYINKKDEGGVHFATVISYAKDAGFIINPNKKSETV